MGTHFKGRPAEVRALDAYVKLVRATASVHRRIEKALTPHRLTENQLAVLEVILHLGPQCQRALAEKLLTSGPSVTLLIDQLEERGHVRRQRSADDRRFINVELTAEGRRFIEKIFPGHVVAIVETFGALTATEQEELGRLCKKLGVRAAEIDSSDAVE